MNGSALYLDTSAFLKLVMPEPETQALKAHLRHWTWRVSATLLCTEALRAVSRAAPTRVPAVRRLLRGMVLVELDRDLLNRAGILTPVDLRSLDAIHIAAALSLGSDLGEMVTYDQRMASAARGVGITAVSPS